jgi:tRNA(Ile)-lysidine synthetase-like protein
MISNMMPFEPGKYVVAVSGGVDSVVLLHALQARPELRLIVAHFDHGIRPDSGEDAEFVQQLSQQYDLPFVSARAELGQGASEETARQARYQFLRAAKAEQAAKAIITAHHQDDVLETAVINMIRGTSRKGLSSLGQTTELRRPLANITKEDILAYAKKHSLVWHEDSTNADDRYLRNHIRHNVLPRLSQEQRQNLVKHISDAAQQNQALDELFRQYLSQQVDNRLDRKQFIMLPHTIAREVMAAWLRANNIREFDSNTLERAVWAAKTFHSGQQAAMLAGAHLVVSADHLALTRRER